MSQQTKTKTNNLPPGQWDYDDMGRWVWQAEKDAVRAKWADRLRFLSQVLAGMAVGTLLMRLLP